MATIVVWVTFDDMAAFADDDVCCSTMVIELVVTPATVVGFALVGLALVGLAVVPTNLIIHIFISFLRIRTISLKYIKCYSFKLF